MHMSLSLYFAAQATKELVMQSGFEEQDTPGKGVQARRGEAGARWIGDSSHDQNNVQTCVAGQYQHSLPIRSMSKACKFAHRVDERSRQSGQEATPQETQRARHRQHHIFCGQIVSRNAVRKHGQIVSTNAVRKYGDIVS